MYIYVPMDFGRIYEENSRGVSELFDEELAISVYWIK